MRWVGCKPLMIGGSLGMSFCLAAMGRPAMLMHTGPALLIFMLGYIACFALSVGPATWILLTEIYPMPVRGPALALATEALWLANFGVS